ncbi:MAG TPA: hypothetical protein ENI95_07745 [Chloroflexi bacterium]|nr:hypothetical protein [Chloroflexota bacterium]
MGTVELTPLRELVEAAGLDVFYILLISGMWLAITAVYVPGTGVLELGAFFSLILAAVGLAMLPTSVAGLLLLGIALGCFLALIYFRRAWPLIVVGMACQLLGSFLLFGHGARPAVWLILIANAATLAYHQIILLPGLLVQDRPPKVGADALLGEEGKAVTDLDPVGTVQLRGEFWSARAMDGPIRAGQAVRVTGYRGLQLEVVPAVSPDAGG